MPVLLLVALLLTVLAQETAQEPSPPPDPLRASYFTKLVPTPLPALMTPARELTTREILWQIFPPDVQAQYWIPNFEVLQMLWDTSEIVEIVDDPTLTGVKLRKSGKWPLAEKESDPRRKPKYWGLRKSAAGLLYQIADYMRDAEGSAFQPYIITSMVRTWDYQVLLMRTNPTANIIDQGIPATHVLGLAFDITRLGLTPARERRLLKYLIKLANDGKIIYFQETSPQKAFHVIALPSVESQYVAYYHKALERFVSDTYQGGEK